MSRVVFYLLLKRIFVQDSPFMTLGSKSDVAFLSESMQKSVLEKDHVPSLITLLVLC